LGRIPRDAPFLCFGPEGQLVDFGGGALANLAGNSRSVLADCPHPQYVMGRFCSAVALAFSAEFEPWSRCRTLRFGNIGGGSPAVDSRHDLHTARKATSMTLSDKGQFDDLSLLRRSEHNVYPENPEDAVLESFPNRHPDRDYWITFECPEFTARCPVTNQPDFGHIRVRYIPGDRCIESKSLKLYLYAYRNHNTFHEEAVNRIMDDIIAACCPREIIVEGDFNPRGGIKICVTANWKQPSRD
jgi:7-cyano-7-deazaguanine reductase